ncbi:MAG: DUF5663 domain-containing protein [Parcubacteria group bacterium]
MLAQTKQVLQHTGLIDKLSTESRVSLTEKLGDKLEERLMIAIADNIPEDKAKEFVGKLENEDSDLEEYLTKNITNYQDILQKVVADFVAEAEEIL